MAQQRAFVNQSSRVAGAPSPARPHKARQLSLRVRAAAESGNDTDNTGSSNSNEGPSTSGRGAWDVRTWRASAQEFGRKHGARMSVFASICGGSNIGGGGWNGSGNHGGGGGWGWGDGSLPDGAPGGSAPHNVLGDLAAAEAAGGDQMVEEVILLDVGGEAGGSVRSRACCMQACPWDHML